MNGNGSDNILSRRLNNLPNQQHESRALLAQAHYSDGMNERSPKKPSKHLRCLVKHQNNRQTDPKITGGGLVLRGRLRYF